MPVLEDDGLEEDEEVAVVPDVVAFAVGKADVMSFSCIVHL